MAVVYFNVHAPNREITIRENYVLHSSLEWKLSELFRGVGLKKEGEELRMAVDEAMKETGLKRIECQDVPDPSGMKHKQMRYEGIIDMDSDEVYWR